MRPSKPDPKEPDDLFRARLSQQIGRPPASAARLMVGLCYLQHAFALSDEEVVARWVENPYWQYFCGFDHLQLALPIDPSSLVRWRRRIGQDGIELLLQETIAAAQRGEAVKPQSLERVSVDTTVQPKAIAHPLDSRLYHRGREILVRLAKRHGVPLRQSYARLAKKALRLASRYAHARQMQRARREIKRLKTYLGRVFRDVRRKLESRPEVATHFTEALARIERLLAQQRTNQGKLYALHAPEVACIAKGKAHKKYEFGAKVALAVTNREGLVVGIQTHPGNPYDGQTLAPTLAQVERLTGTTPARCFVDRGYQGHGVSGATAVFVAGRRRGITPTIRRELRRRFGDRGDDRPHEARRQARPQSPQGCRGRCHPCSAVRRRPQPAPAPAPPRQASSRPAPPARCAHPAAPRHTRSGVKSTSSEPTSLGLDGGRSRTRRG
jgi:transposase, IS5 family